MSEKAMAREKYDSNEGWLEDVIMNAWLENDLKRERELAHRGLAQEAAIAVAAALPPLRAREEIIEECAAALAQWYPDNANTNAFCAAIRSLKNIPSVQGEGRVLEGEQDHESKTPVVPPIGHQGDEK